MKSPVKMALLTLVCVASLFTYKQVMAGNLYIKPELEVRRAERLLEEADHDFRNGKVHIALSPELSVLEFGHAKTKYTQAIDIIEVYGQGRYTPGDVQDFTERASECDLWIQKSQEALEAQKPKEK